MMQQVIHGPLSGHNHEIWINQVKQNGRILFQVTENGRVVRTGTQSWMNHVGKMLVMDTNGNPVLSYEPSLTPGQNNPLLIDFSGRLFNGNNQMVGTIYPVGNMKNKYHVMQYGNETIEIYTWSVVGGMFELFYKDGVQIAQLIKFEKTEKLLDAYCLCLLDGYVYLADLLVLYTIHFDKREFGHTREAFVGKQVGYHREISFSGIGESKYNKDFLRHNFPNVDKMIAESVVSVPKESKWIMIMMLSLLVVAFIIVGLIFMFTHSIILFIVDVFLALIFGLMLVAFIKGRFI